MSKRRKYNAKAASKANATTTTVNPENEKRRQAERRFKRNRRLRDIGLSLLVLLVLVGVGFQYTRSVMAREDLTRIGQGIPMIVQVHDDNCTTCVLLQRQAKRAMKKFDKSELGYVVADLNKIKSGHFARMHRAGQTTLLLFDAKGDMKQSLVGVRTAEALEQIFKQVLKVETKG